MAYNTYSKGTSFAAINLETMGGKESMLCPPNTVLLKFGISIYSHSSIESGQRTSVLGKGIPQHLNIWISACLKRFARGICHDIVVAVMLYSVTYRVDTFTAAWRILHQHLAPKLPGRHGSHAQQLSH